jgi:hypothetical protein
MTQVINAFHPDYIKTYHPELMSRIQMEAAQVENGKVNGAKSKVQRESVNKGAFTISTFPKTKAAKKVNLAPMPYFTYSKAGTANVTPKGKKK